MIWMGSLLLVLQTIIECMRWLKLTNAEFREESRGEDGLFRGVSHFSWWRTVVVKYWGKLKVCYRWGCGRGRDAETERMFEGKWTGARSEEKGNAGRVEKKGFWSLEEILREEEGMWRDML